MVGEMADSYDLEMDFGFATIPFYIFGLIGISITQLVD